MRYLLLIILLLAAEISKAQSIQSQNSSNNIWSDLNFSYEIFKNFDVKYELGNRRNSNQARASYHDLIVKYSVNDFLKIAFGTRRSNLSFLDSSIFNGGIEEDFEDIADRFHFDVSGRLLKLNNFKMKYRFRAQRKIRDFYSNTPLIFKRTYIRSRILIEYPFSKKLKTIGGSELFLSIEENLPIYIRKYRYTAGIEYDFNKIYSARLQYLFQREVKPSSTESLNIIAFNLQIDLNELSKRINSKN